VPSRRVLRRMPDPTEVPGFPAWSSDGRTVVAGSSTGVVLYNPATGRETGRVKVPGANSSTPVNAVTAGREVMAFASQGQEVLLVDPATARVLRRIALPVPAPAAGISPDGRTLAADPRAR